MAVTNALNTAVVQTELDAIFVQEYEYPMGPGIATAETPEIFKQVGIDNSAHIEEVLSGGGGFWELKGEEQAVPQSSPRVANKATYTASTYANSLQLSKEFFDDNMHGTYSAMVRKFAANARATRDRNAFAVWRNSFTTTLTADGVSFINAAHPTITGGTVSNRIASNPALTETSLNTGIVQMLEMVSQDGVVMGEQPAYLLVAPAEFKNAQEIVQSQLVSDSANNAVNVYSSTYNISVWQSPYLGAAQSGGSDTAWWLLSRNHGVTRYKREEISTSLLDYRLSNNDNYVYKGRFREVYGVTDYVGVVGSDGTGV
jgi:hypothetical protein